ncbi:MAG TPA: hypothetical protein VHG08_29380 [Longimicrobium sp.]|nr:hypothetical protein [Longimicrobium sp.]
MRTARLLLLPLLVLAACSDDTAVVPEPTPEPEPEVLPLGVYEFTITGLTNDEIRTTVSPMPMELPNGISATLDSVSAGLEVEQVSFASQTDGTRPRGYRYVSVNYRVRNSTSVARNNVTFLPITNSTSIPNTPFFILRKFDGTNADPAIATKIVPSGAVVIGENLKMLAPIQDVLQVYEESELAGLTLPAGATAVFPYGFVVRNPRSSTNRTLQPTTDPEDYEGLVTFSFRIPLQPDSGAVSGNKRDVHTYTFRMMAVEDTETRMTESIEEGQDSAAVRRLRARAASLGATTVTVLNGSPAMDPAVPDYPGQRQICSVRTAGTAASPITFMTTPAGYTQVAILRPGETMDSCAPYFRGGTPGRPATNVSFPLTVAAVDRYGNIIPLGNDSIYLETESGPPATFTPGPKLTGGTSTVAVTYSDYGTSLLRARGRRMEGEIPILIAGVTRTWSAAGASTNWSAGGNWGNGAAPMSLDSVVIPASAPMFPTLVSSVTVLGVTVENGATLNLSSFDLTAGGNVTAGLTGGITNTTGRLVLAGTAKTIQGRVPRLRVTGTYSLSANVTARAPIEVLAGRLTSATFRLQAESF